MSIPDIINSSLLSTAELIEKFGGSSNLWWRLKKGGKPQQQKVFKMLQELHSYCKGNGLLSTTTTALSPAAKKPGKDSVKPLTKKEIELFFTILNNGHINAVSDKHGIPTQTIYKWLHPTKPCLPTAKSSVTKVRAVLADTNFTQARPAPELPAETARDAKTHNSTSLLTELLNENKALNCELLIATDLLRSIDGRLSQIVQIWQDPAKTGA